MVSGTGAGRFLCAWMEGGTRWLTIDPLTCAAEAQQR
jgi:hypothetical protein